MFGICRQNLWSHNRTSFRQFPSRLKMNTDQVQEFFFSQCDRTRDQVNLVLKNSSECRLSLNLAPKFSVVPGQCQKISHAPGEDVHS